MFPPISALKSFAENGLISLVELIVVLVILAILAAILVPALLGWIDEAKKKQYVLEARNVYIAAQAIADEKYAKSGTDATAALALTDLSDDPGKTRIETMADVSELDIVNVKVKGTANSHEKFTITGMEIKFKSKTKGTPVYALMDGDSWTVGKDATETGTLTGGLKTS